MNKGCRQSAFNGPLCVQCHASFPIRGIGEIRGQTLGSKETGACPNQANLRGTRRFWTFSNTGPMPPGQQQGADRPFS